MKFRDATSESSRTVIALLLAGLLAISLTFAACGGGGGDDEPEATATTEVAETPTAQASAGDSVTVNESFWHSGWKVTLEEATFDPAGSSVSIDAMFENLGADTSTFDSQLVLIAGGENYTDSTLDQELPNVPGELSGNGVITFRVGAGFSFDDAVLVIGNPANNQARVPLGPQGGDLVTLEPQTVAINGTVVAGAVTLNVMDAEIRADFPDLHRPVEAGSLQITVHFSASVASGIAIGEGVLQSQNVALKLPDGSAVAVISDGRSGVNELLQGKEGTTIPDLSVRFQIVDPPAGQYALVLRGTYGPGRTDVEGELPFTVP